MRAPPQAHILHAACEAVGGVAKLALVLEVTVAALTLWLDGVEQPPAEICRACADIILLK